MRRVFVLTVALALTACGHTPVRQEPVIKTVTVNIPVPVPCNALDEIGPAPDYPDSEEALRSADNIFERVKLLIAGRKLRQTRELSLTDALEACKG